MLENPYNLQTRNKKKKPGKKINFIHTSQDTHTEKKIYDKNNA